MFYLDTSFVIPLFIKEPNSAKVRRWFEVQRKEALALSDWTCTEFASAMGVNVRAGVLPPRTATAAQKLFEQTVTASFTLLSPARRDYTLARQMLTHYKMGLRAGDALHLAIAKNNGAVALMTFDRRMRRAAKSFGIATDAV